MVSPEFLRDDTSLIESLEDKVHEIVAAMELPRERAGAFTSRVSAFPPLSLPHGHLYYHLGLWVTVYKILAEGRITFEVIGLQHNNCLIKSKCL